MTQPNAAGNLSGRRILVVEDAYFIADDLRHALLGQGARIIGPLAEARQAHDVLASGIPIDGAVLDINLRGEMIYAVAEALLERDVPVLFATGYGHEAIPPRFAFVPVWEKPYDYDDLVASLALRLGSSPGRRASAG